MTSLRWLFLVILAAACSSPIPSGAPPTLAPSPVEFLAFASDGLAFEYPSDWRVINEEDVRIGQYTYAVVGTGDWQSGTQHGQQVNADAWIVGPEEVVAHFSYFYSGPVSTAYETPPFDARRLPSGLAATIEDGARSTLATVFVPGHRKVTADVRYGSEPSAHQRSAVHRMIETMDHLPDNARSNDIETGAPPLGSPCAMTTFQGVLAQGDGGGVNLALPGFSWVRVSWPNGWSARLGEDRRVELFDRNGAFVARVWDEVEVGGQGDSNEFQACPDAVEVVRAFPLASE